MTKTPRAAMLLASIFCISIAFPTGARSQEVASARPSEIHPSSTCPTLPAINPAKGFTGNFNNPCYALPLTASNGAGFGGDSNASYSQVFYQVNPGYQLVVLGTFPNARFLSATVYDSHLSVVGVVLDYQMPPLGNTMTNPFVAGATYKPNQMYGFTVSLGGGSPKTVAAGCSTNGSNIGLTVMDGSQIHQGQTWTGYQGLPDGFPAHQTGANNGGMIMTREYMGISTEPGPVVIVRQLSNGCAVPLSSATAQAIVSVNQKLNTTPWLNQSQISAHHQFANTIVPTECFPFDPDNQVTWIRSADWVGRNNTAAAYISTILDPTTLQNLLAGQVFIRIQFPLPTTPSIPCASAQCSLTGNEQIRYFSLEFSSPSATLTALNDGNLVKDPNGNVTLIVGLGATPPASVTAANYYTWVDLTQIGGFSAFYSMLVRNLLPSPAFNCSSFNVPYYTMEFNTQGGYMGAYVPTVDFPTADQLVGLPTPPIRPNSCALPPPPPTACSITRTPG